MKKLSFIAIALVLVLVLVSGMCLAVKPVLKVGSDTTYPPFEFQDQKGEYVGFDMEFIRLVGAEMGMDVQIQSINWDGIIPGLMNGNYDCLISAMTITPDRKKQIDFTTPYFSIRQAIVVKDTDKVVKTPADLVGKTISVQNGTTGDLYASKIADVKMKRFDTNPQAVQELLNNNADAAVMDDLVAYDSIKNNKGLKVVEIKKIDREDYGIGVKKGNDKLLKQINKAISSLKKNGKWDALVKKYKAAE